MPSTLSVPQQKVLNLLAMGSTIKAAADTVGIHRNTIANWRRAAPDFQQALNIAQYEQVIHWRDQMQSLADVAIQNLRRILTDETASPAILLRASLAVLDKVTKPSPAQPELAHAPHTGEVLIPATHQGIEEYLETELQRYEILNQEARRAAQSRTAATESDVEPGSLDAAAPASLSTEAEVTGVTPPHTAQKRTTSMNSSPVRSSEPGRNALCPCGSGLKHKRCCLGKLAHAAA